MNIKYKSSVSIIFGHPSLATIGAEIVMKRCDMMVRIRDQPSTNQKKENATSRKDRV